MTKTSLTTKKKSSANAGSGARKPPPEIPKDMKDPPNLAQGKSFFRCLFNHDMKEIMKDYEEEKDKAKAKNLKVPGPKPMMGCKICHA